MKYPNYCFVLFAVFISLLSIFGVVNGSSVISKSQFVQDDPTPGPGVIQIYYYTTWKTAYLHFDANGGGWTPLPGKLMITSPNTSFPAPQWRVKAVYANKMKFLFNDGNGNWDHGPDGGNFDISGPGIYSVKSDKITIIKKFNPECIHNCSNHGTCDPDTFSCDCDKGYYKVDCSAHCEAGQIICLGPSGKYCYSGKTCPIQPLPGCEVYDDTKCTSDEIIMNPSYVDRRWQTPKRGDAYYQPSYQDYNHFTGYVNVVYSSDRTSAVVTFVVFHRYPKTVTFKYEFDGVQTTSSSQKFDTSFKKTLTLTAFASDGSTLKLEPIDFIWNTAIPITHSAGDYRNGQKGAIVEMFGWPDKDIEQECDFIAKAGYLGVKLFPHQEQVMSDQPMDNQLNPWYFMYQPVSYRLEGRMGTRDDLRRLIATCRSKGVRVYADAVINHMTGNGNDCWFHRNTKGGTCIYWAGKNTSATSSPSPFFTSGSGYMDSVYTQNPPGVEYPAVPYGPLDFHCERSLNDWNSGRDLNAGWLVGLCDLNTERDNVRERIAAYLTDLIGIGFSGFRVDAAKHIHPDDLTAIFSKFRRNMGGTLPDDFFTWLEMLLGGEKDLLMCDAGSDYSFGQYFTKKIISAGFSTVDLNKIKIWASWYPKEPDADCDVIPKVRQVIQNDDHDQQNGGSSSRDMGDKGSVLVIDKDPAKHRNFEEILYKNPYGVSDNKNECPIRPLLSSYYFDSAVNKVHAIPDGKSECKNCRIDCNTCDNVPYAKAYQPNATGYAGPVYTRTHRDKDIVNAMRSWMELSPLDDDFFQQ